MSAYWVRSGPTCAGAQAQLVFWNSDRRRRSSRRSSTCSLAHDSRSACSYSSPVNSRSHSLYALQARRVSSSSSRSWSLSGATAATG